MKRWLRNGALVQLQPGVLALPERADDWTLRARAASRWAGGPVSHVSALVAGGLAAANDGPVHVTVPSARCPRGGCGVVAHRSDRRLVTVRYGTLEAVEPERSLVDAWAWAHTPRRNPRARQEQPIIRRAVIEGVRGRAVHAAAVRRASVRLGPHPGGPALLDLLALIAGGCDSELEIWGVQQVLPRPPAVPPYVQQYRLALPDGRRIKLDAAWPEALVAVELDGAAFHGSREARERDLRRDSALAALGWVVLRFSYARLVADPEGCRREIVAAVLARLAH
ncbi:uncharacterized protein DUF559 [Blastococcus colisei]|uniref:Uncharacterized protein DUF559 n=1 Tax=Blastococcus colisei TaxID=1564162 RepID=A0A543PIK5_9ACTN|nr:uncharacterized protein DUF559 [Blastococcus colisei]